MSIQNQIDNLKEKKRRNDLFIANINQQLKTTSSISKQQELFARLNKKMKENETIETNIIELQKQLESQPDVEEKKQPDTEEIEIEEPDDFDKKIADVEDDFSPPEGSTNIVDPFENQPSNFDFEKDKIMDIVVGLYKFRLYGVGNGEVNVGITSLQNQKLKQPFPLFIGRKHYMNKNDNSFHYNDWKRGTINKFRAQQGDTLFDTMEQMNILKDDKPIIPSDQPVFPTPSNGGSRYSRVAPHVNPWIKPKLRDYSAYREKLLFQNTIFNKYSKYALMVLAGLIIGSTYYKWKQDPDEDLREYFKLKRAERRLQERKSEGIVKKQEADRKRIKVEQLKDQIKQLKVEAEQADVQGDKVISESEAVTKLMRDRQKKLVTQPLQAKTIAEEVRQAKTKPEKKKLLRKMVDEIEQKEQIDKIIGSPRTSIEELNIGGGSKGIDLLKEGIRGASQIGTQVVRTGGQIVDTTAKKLIPDVGGIGTAVTQEVAKLPGQLIGGGIKAGTEGVKAAGKIGAEVVKAPIKIGSDVVSSIARKRAAKKEFKRQQKLSEQKFEQKKELAEIKQGMKEIEEPIKKKVILERKEPEIEEQLLEEKRLLDEELKDESSLLKDISKVQNVEQLETLLSSMRTYSPLSSNKEMQARYPEVGIYKHRDLRTPIHGDPIKIKRRTFLIKDLNEILANNPDKFREKKFVNEISKVIKETALPSSVIKKLKALKNKKINQSLTRSENWIINMERQHKENMDDIINTYKKNPEEGIELLKRKIGIGGKSEALENIDKRIGFAVEGSLGHMMKIRKQIDDARRKGDGRKVIELGNQFVKAQSNLNKIKKNYYGIDDAKSLEEMENKVLQTKIGVENISKQPDIQVKKLIGELEDEEDNIDKEQKASEKENPEFDNAKILLEKIEKDYVFNFSKWNKTQKSQFNILIDKKSREVKHPLVKSRLKFLNILTAPEKKLSILINSGLQEYTDDEKILVATQLFAAILNGEISDEEMKIWEKVLNKLEEISKKAKLRKIKSKKSTKQGIKTLKDLPKKEMEFDQPIAKEEIEIIEKEK
jgi:hypothetical protein